MQTTPFCSTLIDAFMISPTVKHFIAQCSLSPPFHYLPGQFITLHFEHEEKTLKRSYSIANAPNGDNRIEFAATFVEGGPGTHYLFHLQKGDSLSMTGPYGRLVLKEEIPQRYILVATGTGITPYKSMLPELRSRLTKNPSLFVVIMEGVPYRQDLLYEKEFQAFANAFPKQVTFFTCLSRETQGSEVKSTEFCGRVQALFPKLTLHHQQDLVYLCGNPSMIDDAFQYLQEQNFQTQQIIREKYISR
jgi:ferredoxin-NADP reductase